MSEIQTYYLVDYENIHNTGLSIDCILNESNKVHLFFTPNAASARLDTLGKFKCLQLHEVPPGKQSLDKHLVSCLGYMVGKHSTTNAKFVVVSSDKGYDAIIDTLTSIEHVNITRTSSMAEAVSLGSTMNRLNVANLHITTIADTVSDAPSISEKASLALSKVSYSKAIVNQTATIVKKHQSANNRKQLIYRSIIKSFGQKKGLEIYRTIKKAL